MLLMIFGIVIFFAMPACIFLYILLYPESENCWASERDKVATAEKIKNSHHETPINVAKLYYYWAISGFIFNVIMVACYSHAMRIPCLAVDLTWIG